jgi:hypothetical protein
MSSNVKRIRKLFPRCPICKSKKGYKPSTFIPDVRCRSCGAEWTLHENGLELKRVSKKQWDAELLDKKYPFDFWKNLRVPKFQVKEQMFAPMDYAGGTLNYQKPAIGYILLKQDSITYKSSVGSLNKMTLKVPIEKIRGLNIRTTNEITSTIGAGSILFKANTEFLVLTYKNQTRKLQHMIFDFHGQKKSVDELRDLVSYLKKEKSH